jgi:hypothetical protein
MKAEKLANTVVRSLGEAGILASLGPAHPFSVSSNDEFPHMPATAFGCIHLKLRQPVAVAAIEPVLDEALGVSFEHVSLTQANVACPALRFSDESGPVVVVFFGEQNQPHWQGWLATSFMVLDHRNMPRQDGGKAILDQTIGEIFAEHQIRSWVFELKADRVTFSGEGAPLPMEPAGTGAELFVFAKPIRNLTLATALEHYVGQPLDNVHLHYMGHNVGGFYAFNRGPFVAITWLTPGNPYTSPMVGIIDQRSLP